MGKVALEGMEFFAYHGFYDEEQKVGNKYAVDLEVSTDFSAAAREDSVEGTVNYETLYQLIKEEMAVSARLLEHLAYRINERILQKLPQVEAVTVSISKFNPPIGGVCQRSRVTLEGKR